MAVSFLLRNQTKRLVKRHAKQLQKSFCFPVLWVFSFAKNQIKIINFSPPSPPSPPRKENRGPSAVDLIRILFCVYHRSLQFLLNFSLISNPNGKFFYSLTLTVFAVGIQNIIHQNRIILSRNFDEFKRILKNAVC